MLRRSQEKPLKNLPKIGEFMDAVVPTLSPETQILKAVDFLLRHRVTGAPVVDRRVFLLCCVFAACGGSPGSSAIAEPTFTRDVAPILYRHCSNCHRPGESAPFDLLTYRDAQQRDKQIAMVTASRFMPPWLPAEDGPAFTGARGLSREQIELLQRWYKNGSPEGDPADLPPMPEWTVGWQLGQPDLEIEPAETYTLPADGVDIFRNLIVPIPNERTRYVRTIDLRPGNSRIVHHAVMRVDRSRSSRLLDQRDPGPGYGGMEWGEAQPPEGHFLGWTPGKVPYAGSDELAWVLEPGSDLIVQLHMLPTGKPEPIKPRIGLYFAEAPPSRRLDTVVLDVKDIDIPAGKRDHVVEESYDLPVAVEIVSAYPHAHYLGRELLGWAELPDGSRQTLIRIPDWDFNWQDQYRYVEPIRLPAGSRVGHAVELRLQVWRWPRNRDVDFNVKPAKARKVENAFGCAGTNVVKDFHLRY